MVKRNNKFNGITDAITEFILLFHSIQRVPSGSNCKWQFALLLLLRLVVWVMKKMRAIHR